jgi:hypothetical protein
MGFHDSLLDSDDGQSGKTGDIFGGPTGAPNLDGAMEGFGGHLPETNRDLNSAGGVMASMGLWQASQGPGASGMSPRDSVPASGDFDPAQNTAGAVNAGQSMWDASLPPRAGSSGPSIMARDAASAPRQAALSNLFAGFSS